MTRRALTRALAATFALPGIRDLEGLVSEALSPRVVRTRLVLPKNRKPPVGLRIVQLSDLHRSPPQTDDFLARCFEQINALAPDLIVLTGDFITFDTDKRDGAGYAALLASLRAPLGVFASFGGHDGGNWARFPVSWMADVLAKGGVTPLENRHVTLSFKDRAFDLVGLADLYSGAFDPATAFAKVEPDRAIIVLSHDPDSYVPLTGRPGDLMLSGHTHGGQVRLPGMAPIVPIRDRRFIEGEVRMPDRVVYVNRGLGGVGPGTISFAGMTRATPGGLYPVRFNCPPEISLHEIAEA